MNDINLGLQPSLEASDVVTNQSNNQYVPPISQPRVPSNVPVSIGNRIFHLTTVSYEVPFQDNIVTTNYEECMGPSTDGELNTVRKDMVKVLMNMNDALTKRIDGMEKKIDSIFQRINDKSISP